MDRAIEVRDLAAQIIDTFGRCDRAGEDGALDLFNVGFEVRDDGAVALDHLVQDCPEHRVSAKCKQFGVLFEPRARAVQLTRDTLSNRYDETRSDEDADLAEIDLALVMVVAGGAQDDQLHPGFVFFDLRAQVKGLGILDGKLVQTERFPDFVELVAAGLDHAQPYEPALKTLRCSLIHRDRPVALTATVAIVSAVDNHRRPPVGTQLLAPFHPGSSLQPRFTTFLEEPMGDRTVIPFALVLARRPVCEGATRVYPSYIDWHELGPPPGSEWRPHRRQPRLAAP